MGLSGCAVPVPRAGLLLLSLALLSFSCAHTHIEDFPFITENGTSVELKESPSFSPGEEGRLFEKEQGYGTPDYRFTRDIDLKGRNAMFFINYEHGISGSVILRYGGEEDSFPLPASDAPVTEAVFPLRDGAVLTGFSVISSFPSPQWRIRGAGIRSEFTGMKMEQGVPVLSPGFGYTQKDTRIICSFTADPGLDVGLIYRYEGDSQALQDQVSVYDSYGNQPFKVRLLPGVHNLIIPGEYFNGTIHVEHTGQINKIELLGNIDNYIDLGMLIAPKEQMTDDYRVYRWTDFPDILLIDTLSYQVQSALFRRLAFFVEKRGYAGRILSDAELEGLHGWNAHDYRAFDLANFFNLAKKEAHVLNTYELQLATVLLEAGIINEKDGFYEPVKGGILSVSRESSDYLRELFLAHEGYHGIFFSEKDFEDYVLDLYNRLDREFLNFWKLFLGWKGYDTGNEYLMANEVQAYLLQLPLNRIDAYYKDYIIPGMMEKFPDTADDLEPFIDKEYSLFYDTAFLLHNHIEERTGYGAGNLFSLKPVRK
ncbi:MAG: hypothetical protein JXB03_12410 [Spirochaetales bacterium]|nr:hypothetical protein [Spirochaetales bacterium]